MKMFNKVKETVEDPKFIQGAKTALSVGTIVVTTGIIVYAKGYFKGGMDALSAIDYGFKKADPEAYGKLLEKTKALVESGVIH